MNLLIIRLIIFAVLFYVGLKLYGIYRQRKLTHQQQTGGPFQQLLLWAGPGSSGC